MLASPPRTGWNQAPALSLPPEGDERWELLEATLKRHQYRQDALIEVLHAAQGLFGHLGPGVLYFIARRLKLPPSRVYGVATFYHFFKLQPEGKHTCFVCTGTACFVRGADELLGAVRRATHLEPGQTTPDGELTLQTVRCPGMCGLAPAVVLDDAVQGHQTSETLLRQVKGWLARGTGGPT
jgi:bidirectional [NiFe] hydrogenase diaphorase subunit